MTRAQAFAALVAVTATLLAADCWTVALPAVSPSRPQAAAPPTVRAPAAATAANERMFMCPPETW